MWVQRRFIQNIEITIWLEEETIGFQIIKEENVSFSVSVFNVNFYSLYQTVCLAYHWIVMDRVEVESVVTWRERASGVNVCLRAANTIQVDRERKVMALVPLPPSLKPWKSPYYSIYLSIMYHYRSSITGPTRLQNLTEHYSGSTLRPWMNVTSKQYLSSKRNRHFCSTSDLSDSYWDLP